MSDIPLHSSREADIFFALDSWFKCDLGIKASLSFAQELQQQASEVFSSKSILQLGQCNENIWLQDFSNANLYVVSPYVRKSKTNIMSSVFQLPIKTNSIDCALLPFTLQLMHNPQVILEEINRILKSCGYAVFLGINPISVWGLWSKYNNNLLAEHKFRLHSPLFIKHQLAHYGNYEHIHLSHFFYLPPINNLRSLSYLGFLDYVGKLTGILPSAFYCLIIRKYDRIQKPLWANLAFDLVKPQY